MYDELLQRLDPGIICRDEPMKNHTTFKIGGPVDMLITPRNLQELRAVLEFCLERQLPLFIFGSGSNLLVADRGIRGVAVKIGSQFSQVQVQGEEIYAQAGISLADLSRQAAARALGGLEFAEGIPGSLGGAIFMNAGAYGGEMSQVVCQVEALTPAGQERSYSWEEIQFGYRRSIFQQNGAIITAARLRLQRDDMAKIRHKMQEYAASRQLKQPLEFPSAGSVFQRPAGYFVGPMLEELGLKGLTVGGAQVSTKHAGFIVNRGDATAQDVLALIAKIKQAAREKFGVDLQTEIRIIGEI